MSFPAPKKPEPEECFYRQRDDGLVERVEPVTGRVVAVLSMIGRGREADVQNFVPVEIDGRTVMVQVGLTNPTLTVTKSCPYSQVLADIICQKLIEEMSLSEVCKLPGFPTLSMVARWRKDNKDFDDMIRYARKVRAERLRDRLMEIAESAIHGTKDDVPGKKLAVEALQWACEKDSPEEYGSKVKIEGQALVALMVNTGISREPLVAKEEIISHETIEKKDE